MKNLLLKFQLSDPFKNKTTLMVSETDGFLKYDLMGRTSKTPHALSNLSMKKPLPDHVMDSDDLENDIRECIETGYDKIEEVKNYQG